MKLVSNWRRAWRWFSVQAMAVVTAMMGGWIMVPDDLRDSFPSWVTLVFHGAAGLMLVLGIAGRLFDQKPKDDS